MSDILTEEQAAALEAWAAEPHRKGGCSGYGPKFDAAFHVAEAVREGSTSYEQRALSLAIYPGRLDKVGITGKAYVGLGLAGEAGEFADKMKKVLRDDAGEVTPERRLELLLELGDVLWYVVAAASELDSDLAEVAAMNLEKLEDRHARDALGGSGDHR